MKYKLYFAIIGLCVSVAACDNQTSFCNKNQDCVSFCATYSGSSIGASCDSTNNCSCVDPDQLSCDENASVKDGEKSHCQKLCDALAPGEYGVCSSSICNCQDTPPATKTENDSEYTVSIVCKSDSECNSVCITNVGSDLAARCHDNGTCSCIDPEQLKCDQNEVVAEGEKSHCQKLCDSVKTDTTGECVESKCQCKSASN